MRSKLSLSIMVGALVAMLIPSSALAVLTVGSTTVTSDGALTMQADAGSAIILGSAAVAGTLTLGGTGQTGTIGLGTGTAAQTINIGTGAAVVKTIAIGGTGANVIAIGNTQTGGSVAIGGSMTTGTITIGGTTQTGTISIGNAVQSNTINIANGALQSGQTGDYSFGNKNNAHATATKNVNIGGNANGSGTVNVNIAAGQSLGGTSTINIATGAGFGTDALNIGHSGFVPGTNAATTTILGNINASGALYLRVPTGTTNPAAGDCNEASEAGKVYVDTDAGSGTLYICSGSAWVATN